MARFYVVMPLDLLGDRLAVVAEVVADPDEPLRPGWGYPARMGEEVADRFQQHKAVPLTRDELLSLGTTGMEALASWRDEDDELWDENSHLEAGDFLRENIAEIRRGLGNHSQEQRDEAARLLDTNASPAQLAAFFEVVSPPESERFYDDERQSRLADLRKRFA